MKQNLMLSLLAVLFLAPPANALWAPGDAPFVNSWLVLGTFDNRAGVGMAADLIGEAAARPRAGEEAAGKRWRYFDDRVFSRNYDDYQDLFSWLGRKPRSSGCAPRDSTRPSGGSLCAANCRTG